jgi:hypothetical protein
MAAEIDSLKLELHSGGRVVENVVSINSLLDSIDATRHTLRMHKTGGTEMHAYDERMLELKEYVKQTEDKIEELEGSMAETDVNASSYLAIIEALKDELAIRNEELGLIEENAELNNEGVLRLVQLEDVESKLEVKRMELKLIDIQMAEMVRKLVLPEAEKFYLQASALEEAARRTKLAPFRRKQIYHQAMALYKKSLDKGGKQAQAKIDDLQAKLTESEE